MGIDKLRSVQTRAWTAWNSFCEMAPEMFGTTASDRNKLKRTVEKKLVTSLPLA